MEIKNHIQIAMFDQSDVIERTVTSSIHSVRCMVCSRTLKHPASVARGIGPVCMKSVIGQVKSMKSERADK